MPYLTSRSVVVAVALAGTLAACSGDAAGDGPKEGTTAGSDVSALTGTQADAAQSDPDPDPDPDAAAAGARLDAIAAAVERWRSASDLSGAKAAAEEARNLITGPDTLDAGDLDGDGTVGGETEVGFLPGFDGRPGSAQALAGCELVERDVLGGSWDDPAERWTTLAATIEAWRPDANNFPTLSSHPQRVVGWATLTLATDSLDDALEYSGHALLHVEVSRAALESCS